MATTHLAPINGSPDQLNLQSSLRSELALVLQTRHGQLMVRGRNTKGKPVIIGLIGFADRLRLVWQAAEEGDPYADWWLVKIHDSLSALEAQIYTESRKLESTLMLGRTMKLSPTQVKDPFRMTLRFSIPYAFRAARVVGDFDELLCMAFTAEHLCLTTNKQTQNTIRNCSRRMRAVFNLPLLFKRLGLTRKDLTDENLVYQRAKDLMGVLPKDIVNGKRKAMFAPAVKDSKQTQIPPAIDAFGDDKVVFE